MSDDLTLKSISKIDGTLRLPGSKSVSNRALILAALANGRTELSNLLNADDVRHMLTALKSLGIACELSEDRTRCTLTGNGKSWSPSEPLELYLGNAGTAMRPLCAALCLGHGTFTLTGEPRMEERPIADLVSTLRQAGAEISYLKNDGYPPLRIQAKGLMGGSLSVRGDVSSQFLSALLMAAPLFRKDSVITIERELVSKPYIALTLDWISKFGGRITNEAFKTFTIAGNQTYTSPGKVVVEGDASAASYFFAAAAIKGGSVRTYGLNRHSTQGDIQFAHVLKQMGAQVEFGEDYIEVRRGPLHGIDLDCNHITDAAMTLAVVSLFAKGPTIIRNVGNWRVKETDRLAAMATELRKTGAVINEGSDFLEIHPPEKWHDSEIDTYQDHRIAMCFSLLALSEATVTIRNPGCVSKTFPDYFEKLESVSQYE